MKKLILLAFALSVIIGASAQNYTMVVQKTDGSEFYYSHEDNPSISFHDGSFTVSSSDNSSDATYSFADVAKIYFKPAASSDAISENDAVLLYPNPATSSLHIAGAGNEKVEIYSMDGKLVYNGINNGKDINVSSLEKGIYAVRINGKTLKFSKL